MARNPLWFLSEAGYMPATGSQIITAATLRAGLGPYMLPNLPEEPTLIFGGQESELSPGHQ